MLNKVITIFFLTTLFSISAYAEEYKTLEERYGYAVGYNLGKKIIQKYSTVDKKAYLDAITDATNGKPPKMTPQQMAEAFHQYNAKQVEARMKQAKESQKSTVAFMKKYSSTPGVKPLSNGMFYRVIKSGKGTSPRESSKVTVHYRGTLIDGTEFDSSYKRGMPATFPLNRVIKGWTITLQKMVPGDKWEVVIPPQLAYGPQGKGGVIGPNATLIFEIELIKVE